MQKRQVLAASVFLCGAVVMVFELAGSRIMAPHYGTSLYVWTGIIGVIMGSLALGYWLGGKLADRRADFETYALVVFGSGLAVFWAFAFKDIVPAIFDARRYTLELASLLSAIWLFAPASVLLGLVTPYAVRLKISSLETSASTVGNLYAASTLGSIVGTFAAGYWLIPFFGISAILGFLAALLAVISFALSPKRPLNRLVASVALAAAFLLILSAKNAADRRAGIVSFETGYNSMKISAGIDAPTGKPTRYMSFDAFSRQGAMFTESDELVYGHTKFYRLADHFKPSIAKALMIGGGSYSYPKDFIASHPKAEMDVVEIDPGVTEAARKFFRLEDGPRLKIVDEDARTFLNSSDGKYDVIYDDAFNSAAAIPFQLSTVEAVRRQYERLSDGGVVVANLISALTGPRGRFLDAEVATFKAVFPQVHVFQITESSPPERLQNVILVAIKSKDPVKTDTDDPEAREYLRRIWKNPLDGAMSILTDDHAPVEYYLKGAL